MNHSDLRFHRLLHAHGKVIFRATFIALYAMLSVSAYAASIAPPTSGSVQAVDSAPQGSVASSSQDASDGSKDGKKSSSSGFRVAQVDRGSNSQSSSVANIGSTSQEGAEKGQISEVIVTAEKREERLKDVPIPVTALNASTLVQSNQTRLQDYFSSVPGLNLTPGVEGDQNITIRGIGFGFANATTGITVDDVPFGSAAGGLPTGLAPPDLDPSDLSRIEVLRGPQGTLYGASSMGGLIKYVTAEPSMDRLSGTVQAGTSTVFNGAELGYNFRGSVNIPLGDTFAIRANAFTREDPGYIDNVRNGQEGINEIEVSGGHLAALWRPSETFSIKLGALYQVNKGFGQSEVDNLPGLRELQQDRLPNSGRFERELQGYSAVINAKIGAAELTAVTGYSIDHDHTGFDFSNVYGRLVSPIYGSGNVPIITDSEERKFTQELRLSVPVGSKIDWLIGAFYSNDKVIFTQDVPVDDFSTGALIKNVFQTCLEDCSVHNLDEIAAFTDITYHFTDKFDVQIGGRESRIRQWATAGQTELALPPFGSGVTLPGQPTSVPTANAFTYLLTPRFKVSEDLMVYARVASGYRPGGGGIVPGGAVTNGCIKYNFPCEHEADKTENYEIGAKGNLIDRLLSFDTSIYYINWKDIQLNEYSNPCGCTYLTNGSAAKSEGIELSLQSEPATGLKIAAWGTWDNAELTRNLPVGPGLGVGLSGATLPLSVKWSGNVSVNQTFPLTDVISATVGGDVGYLGSRPGLFPTAGAVGVTFPAYTKVDLRAELAYQSWSVDVSANNVTNKIVEISGGPGFFPTYAAAVLQPRTIALSVRKTF
jgi:iron complex outermembrane receptor protein